MMWEYVLGLVICAIVAGLITWALLTKRRLHGMLKFG
jgi:hypothetical protein